MCHESGEVGTEPMHTEHADDLTGEGDQRRVGGGFDGAVLSVVHRWSPSMNSMAADLARLVDSDCTTWASG